MESNIGLNNITLISRIQRRYRFLATEIKDINNKLIFYKDILMSMLNNLNYLNKIKVFQNTESHNMIILEELNEIKLLLDKLPDKISLSYLKKENLSKINLTVTKTSLCIIKYFNHIAPENINYIMKILFGNNWLSYFDESEIDILLFLSRFFKPICIWSSVYHKEVINYIKSEKLSNIINKKKESNIVTKNILETLLKGKSENISSIVIGESSIPSFLQSINEIIGKSNKNKVTYRKNNYKEINCIAVLDHNKIKITKNKNSISLLEDNFGSSIYMKLNNEFVVIQGIFKDDLLNISKTIKYVKEKFLSHKGILNYEVLLVPKKFKESYIETLNLRDIMVSSSEELIEDVRKKYNDFKILQGKPLLTLINEFLLASKYRKIDILTLLLLSNDENKKLAYVLYDIFKTKDKKDVAIEIYNSLHYSIRDNLNIAKKKVEHDEKKLSKISTSDIPYQKRILLMKTNDEVKNKALSKLKSIKNSFQGDNKAQNWLDGLLKIPFGIYRENDIISFKNNFLKKIEKLSGEKLFSVHEICNYIEKLKKENPKSNLIEEWNKYQDDKCSYIKGVRKTLDEAVFGHKEAKTQLERIFAQWINGESKGAIIGLQGPPGTGKTSLAKNGLSKCLIDNNCESRPFAFLPIGGSVNGSTLVGHNYTYVGSTWGRIVDVLITSQCMNPIIFIDEVDKISSTEHGREIVSILTHLTDLTQNDEFEDKYFSGIKLDLSKALIVFSFNDVSLLDPILRDRITIIETKPLTIQEKIEIIKNYMLPEILKDVGFSKNEIILPEDIILHLIETYTNEAGVRKIKEKIVEIIRDINLKKFHDNIKIPYTIDKEYIKLLFENKPKVRIKKIIDEPEIGLVNGLYATVSGIGGLTVIQAMKYPADKMFELSLTGKQGEVMKESVDYALKIAFTLLSKEKQNEILKDAKDKKTFGIHIHTPEAAVPKDGPSAGAAMTLAIYSLLSGRKVNNKIALTGEIDLCKQITAIGGVYAKLNGAKRAGVTKALIPEENMEDLERLRRENISPEDENFKVYPISKIEDVLNHCIINEDEKNNLISFE
jgi:hypothetical protein